MFTSTEQLSDRGNNAKLLFVYEVLSGRIHSPILLWLFDINIPFRPLRNYSFFRIRHHRTNYGSFEPVLTMLSMFNEMYYRFFQRLRELAERRPSLSIVCLFIFSKLTTFDSCVPYFLFIVLQFVCSIFFMLTFL